MTRRRARGLLAALLAVTLAFSLAWALVVPVPVPGAPDYEVWGNWQPDEGSHVAVASWYAEHGTQLARGVLPPYDMLHAVSVHPPAYHLVAGAVLAVLGARLGMPAAVRAVRVLGCLVGLWVVILAWRAADELFDRRAALFAAAIVALVPTRLSLSAGLSNENLAALGAAGTFAVLAGGVRRGFDARSLLAVALWSAIGVGSKLTCLGVLPAIAVCVAWSDWRRGFSWVAIALRLAAGVALPLAVFSGWAWLNLREFGDPFRSTAEHRLWEVAQPGFAWFAAQRGTSASRYLASLVWQGWRSFWAAFAGVTAFLPTWVYVALAVLPFPGLAGLTRMRLRGPRRTWLVGGATCTAFLVGVYLVYNWSYYTPQGRYFFPCLLPMAAAIAAGWRALAGRWFTSVAVAGVAVLAALNVWCLAAFLP